MRSIFWTKRPSELTEAELQEAIDDAIEFIDIVDKDPILQGDGADKERTVWTLATQEQQRRGVIRAEGNTSREVLHQAQEGRQIVGLSGQNMPKKYRPEFGHGQEAEG